MKINKLRLKNFRAYEDEIEFDFTTTENKNIILIGGENGAGKSTIFESIKLCIYGPLAYRYQGQNSSYINKIKSNINNNSLINSNVESFVSIDIELVENTEKNVYTLKRKWIYKDKKISEEFKVYKNYSIEPLDLEEQNYFENYLKSIISPKLFDFFFFDGELLSNFFISKQSNSNLNQALLTLCNYDTLDVLQSTIMSTRRKFSGSDNKEIEEANINYLNLENKLADLYKKKYELESNIGLIETELEELEMNKSNLEKSFRKRGGLLAEEIEKLNKEITNLENRRGELNILIKNFCNEILPFLILKNKLPKLKEQIENENKILVYTQLQDKLNYNYIFNIIKDKVSEDQASVFAKSISDAFIQDLRPKLEDEDFEIIHRLSNDESNSILSNIKSILNYDSKEISSYYDEIRYISKKIEEIRSVLKSSLDNEGLNEFIINMTNITDSISKLVESKNQYENEIEQLNLEINSTINEIDKAKSKYFNLLKSNNIVDMSGKIIVLLNDIISTLTKKKIQDVKENFMYIFKRLFKKDGFIEQIDIDDNFNVSLYINKLYGIFDIENMLENIGYVDMYKKLGRLFFKDLYSELNIEGYNELKHSLKNVTSMKLLNLRTKIDIESLSNGEKQIYILCLYWSLIKASGMDVPFIIDTPFARIDEIHRQNIVSEFFSTISSQVIILSTNTEIDQQSYKALKDIISKEYLIEYDDKARKTRKFDGYFYEV